MLEIRKLQIPGFEQVVEAIDPELSFHCLIAVHSTALGPALGGVRIFPYRTSQDALNDVLRLAQAMTMKSAIAGIGLGGGKAVIIADSRKDKSKTLLHTFGKVLDSLGGAYIAAEDVGSSIEDMTVIHEVTPYVAALPSLKSSGDPSHFTAWGVLLGIEAVCQKLYGTRQLQDRLVAIQGLGHVGLKLANFLFWEGANLIVSDLDPAKCEEARRAYGAQIVSPDEILRCACDILAPCAMGGVINEETIPELHCRAIAGSANNQLLAPDKGGEALFKREILYAPDFIINAGGIINASMEFEEGGYSPREAKSKVDKIYDTLLLIFNRSHQEKRDCSSIAEELALYNLNHAIHKRQKPITFCLER